MLNQPIKVTTWKNRYVKGNIKKRSCQICICNTICDMNPKCGRKGCKSQYRQDNSRCTHTGSFPCQWLSDGKRDEAVGLDRICFVR